MIISPTDLHEVKQRKLNAAPPHLRMGILTQLSQGQSVDVTLPQEIAEDSQIPFLTELLKNRKIDLTKHEDMYYAVNRRILPLRQQLARKVYDPYREHAAKIRKLNSAENGFTDEHKFRHIGAFPPDIYQSIIEQYPESHERDLVVQYLLKTPEGAAFATVEKGI